MVIQNIYTDSLINGNVSLYEEEIREINKETITNTLINKFMELCLKNNSTSI